jgi:ribulose-5-phosphate 4-epimerase/fuculose-1-phosphate aldolase
VAALVSAVLAGGGSRAEAAHLGGHPAVAGVISTVAGGVGGPATATKVAVAPRALLYSGGTLYVADYRPGGGSVREVSPQTDDLTTAVGTDATGPLGAGGPSASADVNPSGVATDHFGNVVITTGSQVVVAAAVTGTFYGQSMTAGDVYTVAGNGTEGYTGNKGAATKAELAFPFGVAVDSSGNLVVADTGNSRVRVVATVTGKFYGQSMTAGDIYTVAGDGTSGFSGDGGLGTSAALNIPEGVAVDGLGNLVIADTGNSRVRVVAAHTGTFYGQSMTAGDIYTVAGDGTAGFSGDGGPATSAGLNVPEGTTVDSVGNLLIDDTGDSLVRIVAATTGTFYGQSMTAGDIYTVAGDGTGGFSGDGGPATSAGLNVPGGIAVDGAGNLLIADTGNDRVRIVAATTDTFYGQAMTAGDIYTIAGDGQDKLSGVGDLATDAELSTPAGVAVDGGGNTLVADTNNNEVLAVPASTGKLYSRPVTAGRIYDEAGDGTAGFSGDGGLSQDAEVDGPYAVTADGAGNMVIADTGNNRIRVVAAHSAKYYGQSMVAGKIYTVAGDGTAGFSGDGHSSTAAALNGPEGLAVDSAGNLVIADTGNYRIRVVAATTGTFYGQSMTAKDIYTVAGDGTAGFSGDAGPATSAELSEPAGVASDSAGNLVLADSGNDRVRVVAATTGTFYGQAMTAGDIYTVAGDGTAGFSGDAGPATSAELNSPDGVAVDSAGNLVLADSGNDRVRVVAATTGTFYGQSMTAGDIYTVAGDGTPGFSGDGGPATAAELNEPAGVALDAAGDLLIADTSNGRIREVAAN